MEENKINIIDLLTLAWRRLWILILAAAICASAAFCYCKFMLTPSYSATASIIVTNGAVTQNSETPNKTTVAATDISASLYIAYTAIDILGTPDIYKRVAQELGEEYNYQRLMGSTTVQRRGEETLFVDVKYSSTDPKEAMRIANKFAEISCEYIPEFIPYSKAVVASTAIKATMTYPSTNTTTVVAGLVGAIAAYVIVFIVEILNRSIKGEEQFVEIFDIPLLGAVPDFENADQIRYRKSKGGYSSGY